jgi:hypothetical protein
VKAEFPSVRVIWGFSNTTFFHTPIPKLPPGIDGQSYHPYGTGTRKFEGTPPRRDQTPLEGFTPRYEIRMPEGIAHYLHPDGVDHSARQPARAPYAAPADEHSLLPLHDRARRASPRNAASPMKPGPGN